jgi:hypothetical protein
MRFNRFRSPGLSTCHRIYPAASMAIMISTSSATLMNVEDSSELLGSDNSAIRYQVGNPHFEGQTVVVIRGDAIVSVDFIQETEKRSYRALLDPGRFEQIAASIVDPRKIPSSGHNPVPDEAEIQIQMVLSDRVWTFTFRDRDRWSQPDLQKDIELFEGVARDVSNGAVQF